MEFPDCDEGNFLEERLAEDDNDVLSNSVREKDFVQHLNRIRYQVVNTIAAHLNSPPSSITLLGEVSDWNYRGSYVCILFDVTQTFWSGNVPNRGIIRFPNPYRTGESTCPGNVTEKTRCDVATHIWIKDNCPEVPLPRLLGFGFPGSQSVECSSYICRWAMNNLWTQFTSVEYASLISRIAWHFSRGEPLDHLAYLTSYVPHHRPQLHGVGYIIEECIEDGHVLLELWEDRDDLKKRTALFRSLSRIILRLAALPLPTIGSWAINNKGFIRLSNRAVTQPLQQIENARISTGILRDKTYDTAASYVADLRRCYDNLVRSRPALIQNEQHGDALLAPVIGMEGARTNFTNHPTDGGPFIMSMTSLLQRNIILDEHWNIVKLVGLEWVCVHPLEMISPPSWLVPRSSRNDAMDWDPEDLNHEFIDIFEEEELAQTDSNKIADIMRAAKGRLRIPDATPAF